MGIERCDEGRDEGRCCCCARGVHASQGWVRTLEQRGTSPVGTCGWMERCMGRQAWTVLSGRLKGLG
ncbi:hypothetical protein B0T18DRAFT_422135 [Schizothecium vesticola]|uniref:Uncharacterized protein n=1 Tax=Schizothecium vesticola TaxID=314040 RepID=A0AA40BQF9_9PEZI|nr:hypothetical protein B0T18DRAFT_422135 [Schizothecium vesticola]